MAGSTRLLGDAVGVQLLLWGYAVMGEYHRLDAAWERGHSDHPELWDRTRRDLNTCVICDADGERNPPDWWALAGAFDYMQRAA